MTPIIKWKDGTYSRLLLPNEINFDTVFQQHNNKMFGLGNENCCDYSMTDWQDIYDFLNTHQEYLFDGDTVGKVLWDDDGLSYLIQDTKYVVNIPSIEFPNLDNYVDQRVGPLTRQECRTVYTKSFFSTKQNISLNGLKRILENKNG